jgi:hypothetical protein
MVLEKRDIFSSVTGSPADTRKRQMAVKGCNTGQVIKTDAAP